MQNNLYIELNFSTNRENLKQISRYQNIYLKVWTSNLKILTEIPNTSNKHLTVEIVNDCKLEKEDELEKFISIHKPKRIIITINKKINVEFLSRLSLLEFKNISLDLYLAKPKKIERILSKIIDKLPQIKHFSIYPLKGKLSLEHNFLGFTRYHHNMWSKNVDKYYAHYDLQTIKERKYLGIGKDTVSRTKYKFYKNGALLNIDKKYIDIQDHIDRLNYYLPLEEQEFDSYQMIKKQKYLKDLENKEIMQVHQELISNLLEL